MEKSRLNGTYVPSTLLLQYGEVVFNGTYVPNPTFQNNLWRSRLVWSRARDWKSRNRQKRFKSSNLFFSATERQSCETRRVAFFLCSQPCLHEFASIRKAKMRSIAGLLTMAGDLRRREMFVAEQRLTSSSHATVFTRVCEHKKSKNAKHCRIAYDGRRPAAQRDVRCRATTYIFFSRHCKNKMLGVMCYLDFA